jgi:hypothetical protein
MTDAEAVQRQLAAVTRSRSEAGVFVRMDGRLAVVNIGTSTVTIPCVGFYPPLAGMPVRVDWVNGSPAVTGPVQPKNPIGEITATGTPLATVDVDGESFMLFYRDGYTPTIGDLVEINWTTSIIQGKITGVANPEPPGESGGATTTPFYVVVRAENSGRYQPGSGWWGNDPWASSSNEGIWTYGNRLSDAVGAAVITAANVYLPLWDQVGDCYIGAHSHPSLPGGAPAISSLVSLPIGQRSGWVTLTPAVGQFLVDAGGRGVGVTAFGNGYNRWAGTSADGLSGAIALSGYR